MIITKTQFNLLNYAIAIASGKKISASVRMKLSVCAGLCLTVSILRRFCVLEKELLSEILLAR